MASLSLRKVTINCSVEPPPNVLADTPRVCGDTFHITNGIHVGTNGLVLDQTAATRSGVPAQILHTVRRIQRQSAGSILSVDQQSGPSGSGRFANVLSASLKRPTGITVKVCCKVLTTLCPNKQNDIAKELNTLLYIGFGHPNIYSAIDMQFDGDRVLVVFPSLDITIHDMCENLEGTLDARARFRVIFLLLNALRYLHNTLKLLHRDVTGKNVMVWDNGGVMLIDMGSAQNVPDVVPLSPSTTPSHVPPPLPDFCWADLFKSDTDRSPFLTFRTDKKFDDVCGALLVLEKMSDFAVDATQPPAQLDLTFTSTHDFLEKLCVFYLHKDSTIPDSEELYQTMRVKVQEDPTRIYYPGWSSDIRKCLSAKACKSSIQR